MKNMQIFEPAMCCSTGLCGVGVDPELLRVSTVLNTLKQQNIAVDRFNLSSAPSEFIANAVVQNYLKEKGVKGLPLTLVDGKPAVEGRYPTNEEFTALLQLPEGTLTGEKLPVRVKVTKKQGGCGCKGRCC